MDPDHLGYLIDRYLPALVLYARQWCRAPEDVVQESFIKLAKQGEQPLHPVAWLYRAVRNRAISESRAERRRQTHEGKAAARTSLWFTPAEDTAGLDAQSATTALGSLPLDQREIIIAHLWGGLTFEQIADLTDGSAATCWRRYAAGVAALRHKMGVPCPTGKTT